MKMADVRVLCIPRPMLKPIVGWCSTLKINMVSLLLPHVSPLNMGCVEEPDSTTSERTSLPKVKQKYFAQGHVSYHNLWRYNMFFFMHHCRTNSRFVCFPVFVWICIWMVVWNICFPYIGNNHPHWLIFFWWVETTNQVYIIHTYYWVPCNIPWLSWFSRTCPPGWDAENRSR